MELTVTDLNVDLSKKSKRQIRHKIRRMFERVCDKVYAIKVVINDINGPKGGMDKICRVIIRAKGSKDVIVTVNKESSMAAVHTALSRARATLLKKVKRDNKLKHQSVKGSRLLELNATV